MPDEARTQDAAGAEAFVRYYIDLINRTSTVMDAEPLRDLSAGCRDCDRIADNVEKDSAAGYHYVEGAVTVLDITAPVVQTSTAETAMRVDQAAGSVIDRSGRAVPGLESSAYPSLSGGAALEWDPTRRSWVMTTLTLG